MGIELRSVLEKVFEGWLEKGETKEGLKRLSRMGRRGGLRGLGEGSKGGRIVAWGEEEEEEEKEGGREKD